MSYPFRHIPNEEKVVYKTTFMQSVCLKMAYDGEKEDFKRFNRWLKDTLGFELTDELYSMKNADSLRFKNDKGNLKLKFEYSSLEFLLSGDSYSSFKETLLPWIEKFRLLFKSIGSDIRDIHIEKINIWPFDHQLSTSDYPLIFKSLLSTEMTNEIKADNELGGSKTFENNETQDFVFVKYALFGPSDSDNNQPLRLVLDSEAVYRGTVAVDSLVHTVERLNNLLYDVYHWSVSKVVIDAMTKLPDPI